MRSENAFSLKVLVVCIIMVGALVAGFHLLPLYGFRDISHHVAPYAGLAGLAALLLWLIIHLFGRKAIKRAAPLPKGAPPREKSVAADPGLGDLQTSSAIQILAILQRQGRFIDFLQEDLSAYSDEQVGAAVRNVHQGCKEALAQHLDLAPIMKEEEGERVTVQPGFDLHSIRLSGNVSGDPPFKGTLRHHGWRAVRVDLPKQVSGRGKDWVLAPAEVEV